MHVVITGASAGIGAELARQLAARGCVLSLAARRMDRLEQLAAELRAGGARVACFYCDVTEREQVLALAAAARAAHGEIGAFISNAGQGIAHSILEATEDDMLAMYRLNCLSALWAYQALAPGWTAAGLGGLIVDVASVGGKVGFPYSAGYVAAKHALSGLGDTARQELAGSGVRIMTIYPGPTRSEFGQARLDRTGGRLDGSIRRLRGQDSGLLRRLLGPQPTAYVARRIVRLLERPHPLDFPHRPAALGALLYNLQPGWVLRQFARLKRGRSN